MEERKVKGILLSKDLDAYRHKELDILLSDPKMVSYIKELGISTQLVIDYLDIFLDIKDDFSYCANCPGIASCKKKNPAMLVTPLVDGGYIERKVTLCPVAKRKLALERKFLVRDFSDEWLGRSIRNKFDLDITESRKVIIAKFLTLLKNKDTNWMYIHGGTRLGKTYITALFIQSLLDDNKGTKCAFLDCATRIKELNDLSFTDKVTFNELFKSYVEVDYLVLDDFGNEYKNEYIRDTIIYPLLSSRAKENKPIYFISHYSLSDIVTMYSINASGKIRAKQLGDLIKSLSGKEIHLEGIKVY